MFNPSKQPDGKTVSTHTSKTDHDYERNLITLRKNPATQTNILDSAPVMFSEASKPASQPSDSSTHPAIGFTKRQKDRIIMLLSQERVYSDLRKLIYSFNPESAEDWNPKDILASVFGI